MTPQGAWLSDKQRKDLNRPLMLLAPSAGALVIPGFAAYEHFFPSLLIALVFVTAIAVGAGLFVVGQQALGAKKTAVYARRPMEWLSQGVAYTIVMWFALWVGGKYVFAWWPHGEGAGWTERYFRSIALGGRLMLFLVLWTAIAARYSRVSRKQDKQADPARTKALRTMGWPVMVLSIVVACAASFDWIQGTAVPLMRLDAIPMMGAAFVLIGLAGALAVLLIYAVIAHRASVVPELDEGRIARWLAIATLLAVIATAAVTLVDDTWRARWSGDSWLVTDAIAAGLALLGLAMASGAKLRIAGAVCVLLAGFLAVYVLVMPSYQSSAVPHWTVPCTLVGALMVLWIPLTQLPVKNALYPINDPNLEA
jgi:hypothetical protein